MKLLKKSISFTIILAMLFSLCMTSVFAADNVYSKYHEIPGKIELEDDTVKIEKGAIIKAYIYADTGAFANDSVTAFHLLGSVSDNLEIVSSGFAGDEALLTIDTDETLAGDIPEEYADFNKLLHNSKTIGQTIDFTAVVFPNDEGNAIEPDENGFAKLIWLELKVVDSGDLKINLDDSFVKFTFTTDNTQKACMKDVSFSKKGYVDNDDGTTLPSGTVTGGGGFVSNKTDGKITEVEVEDADVVIDQDNKTIDIEVPFGTDLTNVVLDVEYIGKSVSVKKGETIDLSEPFEIKVIGSNGKEISYTINAKYKESDTPVVPDDGVIFSDVELDRWSHDMIKDLYLADIVHGYGLDEKGKIIVKPDDHITREEAAKIAVTAYGLDISEYTETSFVDNDDIDDWAVPYVAAGAAHPNKMVRGYAEDNTFRPFKYITREELVTIIINTFGFGVDENAVLHFDDANEVTWAAGYISKAVNLGIAVGYEDNTFKPKQLVTREEALAMFDRALILFKSLVAQAE